MKIFATSPKHFSGRCALMIVTMLVVTLMTASVAIAAGPAAVNLGTAANFAALAKTGISATGTTSIVGDIGISPAAASYITGLGLIMDSSNAFSTSSLVTGKIYAADYTAPTPTILTTAVSDMETAYTDAAGRVTPDYTELFSGDVTGKTLTPGLYKWGTGVLVSAGGVTISGAADDVWIFQIAQDLTVANNAIVSLGGDAKASNIFWQVAGQVTLGTTSAMKGNILCMTLIEIQTGAMLDGRALAQTAVTLDANAVTKPVEDIPAGVFHHFTIDTISTPQTAGSVFAVTITAQDVNNNTVTGFAGTVDLTTNAGTISPTTSNTFTNGQLTQNVTVTQAGTDKTIIATKSGGSETGTSNTLTVNAGQATNVLIETAADGSGLVAPAQVLASESSITFYAIARDANNNFVGNVAADNWMITNVTGGVVSGDLVQSGDKKSAMFTAHSVGTAEIKATSGTLTTTNSGTITVSSQTFVENDIAPNAYSLSQNFPNPFNPSTTIQYSLVNAGMVSLKVYNVVGQEVATLVNDRQEAGQYTVTFNADDGITSLTNGVYFYRLEAGSFVSMRKFVFMK